MNTNKVKININTSLLIDIIRDDQEINESMKSKVIESISKEKLTHFFPYLLRSLQSVSDLANCLSSLTMEEEDLKELHALEEELEDAVLKSINSSRNKKEEQKQNYFISAKKRSELIEEHAKQVYEGMDYKCLFVFAIETIANETARLSNDDLIETLKDECESAYESFLEDLADKECEDVRKIGGAE